MTLGNIAKALKCELIGDKDVVITKLASIESASQGELTFASEQKYIHRINDGEASAYIILESLKEHIKGKNILISKNPYYSFAKLLDIFHKPEHRPPGIDKNVIIAHNVTIAETASIYPNVFIDEGATIMAGTVIYPGCFIGKNVSIGENTILHPNVVVREDSVIGKNVIIHACTVIGSDGFGYVLNEGRQVKIPQVGRVVIEDDVEIGSNVSMDRAALGETVIGEGTKIDNLVQIAHNVKIGKNCVIAGQVGIAGSAKLGNGVVIAGQSGVLGHRTIGDGVIIASKSGVTSDLKDGEVVSGYPSQNIADWRKSVTLNKRLPEMRKKIIELEKKIKTLLSE